MGNVCRETHREAIIWTEKKYGDTGFEQDIPQEQVSFKGPLLYSGPTGRLSILVYGVKLWAMPH